MYSTCSRTKSVCIESTCGIQVLSRSAQEFDTSLLILVELPKQGDTRFLLLLVPVRPRPEHLFAPLSCLGYMIFDSAQYIVLLTQFTLNQLFTDICKHFVLQ